MEVSLPVPRKDFIVDCLVQVPRRYTIQDRLCSGEVLKMVNPSQENNGARLTRSSDI